MNDLMIKSDFNEMCADGGSLHTQKTHALSIIWMAQRAYLMNKSTQNASVDMAPYDTK